ncbi:tetratricopeptide repeat protein [Sandaracinus amylolyticus]|uniref:tetratricopeptide repeat protein n=1 Tax=Sandaracinus amylolyticus TaxID=927083 RepID=UPI001F3B2B1A|nr:tetratricopeptide repeat protein [Sandaracinus amylolyticus]
MVASHVASPHAHAQQSSVLEADARERRTDLARTLFAEGVQLVAEQRWAQAESRFRQALANRDAPPIRYNLASVLFEQGEYPEASVLVESVLADSTTPPEIREHAADLRRHIAERAGYVRLDVRDLDGADIAIDEYTLRDPSTEVPLAPGAHAATASYGMRREARAEIQIATGEHRVVALERAQHAPEDAVSTTPSTGGERIEEQWWFWTAIGGGVVAIAVVIGVVAAVSSDDGQLEAPIPGDFEPGVLRW